MAKLLKTKDKILIALSIFGDLLEDIRDVGGLRSQAYQNVYGYVPQNIKPASYKSVLRRMLQSDLIEKTIVDGKPVLKITSQGKNKISRNFPLFSMQDATWDQRWRVLIFDIPEKLRWKRDYFREKIKNLGFGMIQQSVWISPHAFEDDIREFIRSLKLEMYVYVFVAYKTEVGGVEDNLYKIWKLDELDDSYEKLYHNFEYDVYMEVLEKDPFLPRDILPDNWWGFKLRKKLLVR